MAEVGNEQNLDKVRNLMSKASEVNAGANLTNSVAIDYKTYMGTHVEGTVVFKRPNMNDYMKMGAIKSEIFRTQGIKDLNLVDAQIKFMAHVISTLKVVVKKSPEWLLDIESVEEPDVLYHVYAKYEEWENSFRKSTERPEDAEGDSEPSERT